MAQVGGNAWADRGNDPCNHRGAMVTTARWGWLVTAALALLGCDPVVDDEAEPTEADFAVVERTGDVLMLTTGIGRLSQGFTGDFDISGLTDAQIRAAALIRAENRIGFALSFSACESTIASNGVDTLDVEFSGCSLWRWTVSGEVSAVISVTTPECGEATCPRVGMWSLDIATLQLDRVLADDIEIHGGLDVWLELQPGGSKGWAARGLVIEGVAGRIITADTEATLTASGDDEECLTLDLGSRLQIQPEDDLDAEVGDIYVSTRGFSSCEARCPTDGEVDLSYGAGNLLRWTYDGDARVTVTGPRGRSLSSRLECLPR